MPEIINEEGEVIAHYGILGMKWGVRRDKSAAKALRKDQASLKKAGMTKEAAAVGKVASKYEKQAKEKEAINAKRVKELKVIGRNALTAAAITGTMTALFSSTVNRTPQQTRGLVARSAAVSGVFQAVLTNQALKKNK